MTDTTQITRSRGALPHNVRKLVAQHGNSRAADMLGITSHSVINILARNNSSRSVELLAGKWLEAGGTPAARDRLWILKVTPTQMDGLKPVLDAFGVRIAFADDAS